MLNQTKAFKMQELHTNCLVYKSKIKIALSVIQNDLVHYWYFNRKKKKKKSCFVGYTHYIYITTAPSRTRKGENIQPSHAWEKQKHDYQDKCGRKKIVTANHILTCYNIFHACALCKENWFHERCCAKEQALCDCVWNREINGAENLEIQLSYHVSHKSTCQWHTKEKLRHNW